MTDCNQEQKLLFGPKFFRKQADTRREGIFPHKLNFEFVY